MIRAVLLGCLLLALVVGIVVWKQKKKHGEKLEGATFNDMVKERMANFPPDLIPYVDKLNVKEIAASCGLAGVPPVDVHTSDSFVLKPNNSTGKYVIVEDGRVTVSIGTDGLLAEGDTKERVRSLLPRLDAYWAAQRMDPKEDFYNEIPYQMVVEKLLDNKDDYKFHTTDGKIHLVQIHYDRDGGNHEIVFVDENYRPSPNRITPSATSKIGTPKPKPRNWDKMVAAAKRLSAGMDYVRIDFYEEGPYVGEFTFTPNAGNSYVAPPSFDGKMALEFKKKSLN